MRDLVIRNRVAPDGILDELLLGLRVTAEDFDLVRIGLRLHFRRRKLLVERSFWRISVSLCCTSGWLTTVTGAVTGAVLMRRFLWRVV